MAEEEPVAALLRVEERRKLLKRRRRADAEDARDVLGEDDELDMSTRRVEDEGAGGSGAGRAAEDAGPVREELVGFAAARRATARRGWRDDDGDGDGGPAAAPAASRKGKEPMHAGNGRAAPGAAAAAGADAGGGGGGGGVRITPFNLDDERREGSFDEAGHFVSRRKAAARRRETGTAAEDEEEEEDGDGEGDEADWWLEGAGVADLDKIRRRRVREMEARRASARDAPGAEMDELGRAALKGRIIALMMRGETVGAAVRRLGGAAKRGGGDAGGARALDELVGMANALMDDGDLDAYTLTREDLERGATMFGPGGAGPSSAGAGAGAGGDDGDDMFADDEDAGGGDARDAAGGGDARDAGGGGDARDALAAYRAWPVPELRRFLRERPHPRGFPRSINDREELVRAAAAAAEVERRTNRVSLVGFSAQAAAGGAPADACPLYANERLGLYYYPDDDVFCRCGPSGAAEWLRPAADAGMYGGGDGTYFHLPSGRLYDGAARRWL